MKDKLLRPLKRLAKPSYYAFQRFKLISKRKVNKTWWRVFPPKGKTSYSFAILCIKKTEYADMAIINVNSLLAVNPTHSFTLYCDTICADHIKKNAHKLDYPEKTTLLDAYGVADKAWQYYKIEVHIQAAKNGQIDTDADGIWHEDPVLDRSKITMLAYAHDFADMPNEVATLKHLFPDRPDYLGFRHCVAAFVSMPPEYMTDKVANDLRKINDTIFSSSLEFLPNEKERGDARRLSEEFAVNLAIQGNYPQDKLVVLKAEDGWGNKKILQSLYYGCGNQINE